MRVICQTLSYAKAMNIDRIELREIRMKLKQPFETSFGVTTDRRMILVSVFSNGLFGIGEVPAAKHLVTTTKPPTPPGAFSRM